MILISKLIKVNKILTNVLLSIGTIVFVFTLSETFLRLTHKNITYFESRFGYYRSDFDQQIVSDNIFYEPHTVHFLESDEFKYERKTNSIGLSDKEPKLKYYDNDYLIIGLGDSFTEGDGSHSDSTWLKFLEYKIQNSDSINYEYINAGICGSDPFYEYKLFTDKLMKYNPDLVILTIGSDMEDIILRGGMERFVINEPRLKAPKWEFIYKYSFLFRRAYHSINKECPLFLNEESLRIEKKNAIKQLKNLLIDFEKLSDEKDFELLIVFYPLCKEIETKSFEHWNEVIKFCNYSKINYINLLYFYTSVEGIDKTNVSNFFWKIDKHHNALGYEKFANGVYWKLKQMNLQN